MGEAAIAYGVCPIQHAPAADCKVCDDIEKALIAAVAFGTERAAGVAESMWHASHKDIAAAIRKPPEGPK